MKKNVNSNGRKIYKYKYKPHKRKTEHRFLKGLGRCILTLIIITGLVVLGYSIANPLMNMLHKNNVLKNNNTSRETIQTEMTTKKDESETETKSKKTYTTISACRIHTYDFETENSLDSALDAAKNKYGNNIKQIIVPLRDDNGKIYFSTENTEAQNAKAVYSQLNIKTVIQKIKDAGYEPAAEMNVLDDNIYPKYNKNSGFKTQNKEQWLGSNGKTWLDPFELDTESYITSLTSEISGLGFEYIVTPGLYYPDFSETDIKNIGNDANPDTRGKGLTNLANKMQEIAEKNNSSISVEEDIVSVISGKSEILSDSALHTDGITFIMDFDELKNIYSSKTSSEIAVSAVEDANILKYNGYHITFRIKGNNLSSDDENNITLKLSEMGYESFIYQ